MKYLNSQTKIKGRIGNDVEIRSAANGETTIAQFAVATNDYSYKNDEDEWKDKTTWHDVIAMGKVAKSISRQVDSGRVGKGALVEVSGQYRNNNYTDKNDIDRYQMECHIGEFNVLQPANNL